MKLAFNKIRTGKRIATYINHLKPVHYVEPFMGTLGVSRWVRAQHAHLSDLSQPIALLWYWALSDDYYILTDTIDESRYKELRGDKRTTHGIDTAIAGYFFNSYDYFDNYRPADLADVVDYLSAMRGCVLANFESIEVQHSSYMDIDIPPHSVIYCDPPPKTATRHPWLTSQFNTREFWNWCRRMVRHGHTVITTAYKCPNDFVMIDKSLDQIKRRGSWQKTQHFAICVHVTQSHLFEGIKVPHETLTLQEEEKVDES